MVSPSHPIIRLLHVVDDVYPKTKIRKKPGNPLVYTELVIAKIALVMLLKKIKKYKQLQRYLDLNPTVANACGFEKSPDRTTLKRRIEDLPQKMRKRIQSVSRKLCKTLDYNPKSCAVDSTLLAACGPLWHKKDRKQGHIPKELRNGGYRICMGFLSNQGLGAGIQWPCGNYR